MRKRRFVSVLASAIVPGIGQLLLGRNKLATVSLIVWAALFIAAWWVRLPVSYAGFLLIVFTVPTLCTASIIHAGFARNSDNWRLPAIWLLVLVPLALLSAKFHYNLQWWVSGIAGFEIPSTAMQPSIWKGDHLMADIKAYKARSPEEREIVIFKRGGTLYVKRVIGVPGSTLEGRNGEVRLNGIPLQEPYIMHTMPHMMNQLANFGPVQIPAGKLFLMGDNRDVSRDSRSADFGLVDVTELVGKPLYVYYGQLGRIGKNIE